MKVILTKKAHLWVGLFLKKKLLRSIREQSMGINLSIIRKQQWVGVLSKDFLLVLSMTHSRLIWGCELRSTMVPNTLGIHF